MAAQGLPCSIVGVAHAYEEFLDVLICDTRDTRAAEVLRANGLRVQCAQTIMRLPKIKPSLRERHWRCFCFAGFRSRARPGKLLWIKLLLTGLALTKLPPTRLPPKTDPPNKPRPKKLPPADLSFASERVDDQS